MSRRAPLPRLSECRDCHDPIRFVVMPSGKRMPVNPAPLHAGDDHAGRVAAHLIGDDLHGHVITNERPPAPTEPFRFRPHAATCEARQRPEKPAPAPADAPLF